MEQGRGSFGVFAKVLRNVRRWKPGDSYSAGYFNALNPESLRKLIVNRPTLPTPQTWIIALGFQLGKRAVSSLISTRLADHTVEVTSSPNPCSW